MKPSPSSDAGSVTGEERGCRRQSGNGKLARLSSADLRYLQELRAEPRIGTRPLEEERERMRRGQTSDLSTFAVHIETCQTASCPVHILRPREASGTLPVTFYFHGGGWTLGDLKTHAKLVSELAIRSRSAVVFIEYPLAPEHAYPAPLEACISAVAEVLRLAPSLNLDTNRCGFVGDSSGGNLCLAYALLAKDRKLFVPQTQVLLYPQSMLPCRCRRIFASPAIPTSAGRPWSGSGITTSPTRRCESQRRYRRCTPARTHSLPVLQP